MALRMSRWTKAYAAGLIAVALLVLAGAATIPLLDPDEARFARTSVEMLRRGDPVVPIFEGRPRLVKPPLLHWIQMAAFSVAGANELTARLPSALAVLATVALAGWIARRRFGPEAAVWAVATLGTIPLTVVIGRLGTLDALLTLHVFAVVAVDLGLPDDGRRRGALVGALLGLAFLVKGPVGVALPLLIVLAGRTAAGRETVPRLRTVFEALAGWAVVVLPWGLAFIHRMGVDRAADVLRREVVVRALMGTAHVEPVWYYLPVLAVAVLPWSVALIVAFGRVAGRLGDPATRTARYLAAGLVVGVIFFSLSRGKLPTYLAPLMPLAGLLLAWEAGQQIVEAGRSRAAMLALVAGPAAWGAALAVYAFRLPAGPLRTAGWVAGGILLLTAAIGAVAAVHRRPRRVWGAVAVGAAVSLAAVFALVLPELAQTRSAAALVGAVPELRSARPVVLVAMRMPSLTFYLDRIPDVVAPESLPQRLAAGDDPLLVVDAQDLAMLDPVLRKRLREVGRHGHDFVFEPGSAAERTDLPELTPKADPE